MEQTLPLMLRARAGESPEVIAQFARNRNGRFKSKTYSRLYEEVRNVAGGLFYLGCCRGDLVGIISDNRQEWLPADFGVLSIGAADVPRGCDITSQELSYILGITGCEIVFAENQKQLQKILDLRQELPAIKIIITFDPVERDTEDAASKLGLTVYYYHSLIALGKKHQVLHPGEVESEMEKGSSEDLATIIFTSGTTGEPKGVMLSHGNFLHQLPGFEMILDARKGEIQLSVLPVWHVYEREMEYVSIYFTNGIAYSKPIAQVLEPDFREIRPHWMASVPRVWEAIMERTYRNVRAKGPLQMRIFNLAVSLGILYTYFKDKTFGLLPNFHARIRPLDSIIGFFPWILLLPVRGIAAVFIYRRVKRRLGGRFKSGLSGGGSLQARTDHFFNGLGIRLQEAYGLTETAPIVSVRQFRKSRRGTIGQVLLNTEAEIRDGDGKALPPGRNGIIFVRGGQVMKGYYKKPELTAAVLSPEGWLNTGDIGMKTHDNELRITGRAKDTIVLRGGENVEPVPIEMKIRESEHILHCAVVGQDQKYLAALIVPVQEDLMSFAEENNIPIVDYELLLQQPEINELIANDLAALVGPKTGFKPHERIFKFRLLAKPFEQGRELSAKGELLRHRIAVLYAREIHKLFRRI
ncbi:MAG: long-chain fatty acid--CoA ligase [Treponema sp.]|jgi:long-chain acyl-CoA synthetase|nr:long-chain fatty acid--CoA ligase [Treponema sp.]